METVESPEPRHPGLRDCAAALRRHRVLVLGGLAAGLLAAGIALAAVPAAYTAQASVQVEPAGDAAAAGAPPGSASGGVDVATEAQIVRSTEVATEAADLLGTAEAPAALRERVAVEAPPSSSVLDIAYTAGSPQAARRGAAAFADAYLADRADRARTRIDDRLDALRGQLDDREGELAGLTRSGAEAPGTASPTRGAGRAEALQNEITELTAVMTPLSAARDALDPGRVITPAVAPEAPESPRGLLWPAAGGLLGLAAGAAAALAADRRDRTLRTVRDLRRATPLPVLLDPARDGAGRADRRADTAAAALAAGARRSAPPAAARTGAAAGAAGGAPGPAGGAPLLLVVAGVGPGPAAALAAADLAAAFARTGEDPLLVLADPDSAGRRALGLDSARGLAEVVDDGAAAAPLERRARGIRVLTRGLRADAGLMRRSGTAAALLGSDAGTVLVAAAPLAESADAHALAAAADAVLPVVELGRTTAGELVAELRSLEPAGARIPGLAAVLAYTATAPPAPEAAADHPALTPGTRRPARRPAQQPAPGPASPAAQQAAPAPPRSAGAAAPAASGSAAGIAVPDTSVLVPPSAPERAEHRSAAARELSAAAAPVRKGSAVPSPERAHGSASAPEPAENAGLDATAAGPAASTDGQPVRTRASADPAAGREGTAVPSAAHPPHPAAPTGPAAAGTPAERSEQDADGSTGRASAAPAAPAPAAGTGAESAAAAAATERKDAVASPTARAALGIAPAETDTHRARSDHADGTDAPGAASASDTALPEAAGPEAPVADGAPGTGPADGREPAPGPSGGQGSHSAEPLRTSPARPGRHDPAPRR